LTSDLGGAHFDLMKIVGHPRIAVDPSVCGGRPTIAGIRVRVSDVLAMLASGASREDILADYPYLKAEDIAACLAYAADSTGHTVVIAAE
jgi:uncharacterized protein (DUF433 family)